MFLVGYLVIYIRIVILRRFTLLHILQKIRSWWYYILSLFGFGEIKARGGGVDLKYPWFAKLMYYLRLYWWVWLVLIALFSAEWLIRSIMQVINSLSFILDFPWIQFLSDLLAKIPRFIYFILGGLTCRFVSLIRTRKDSPKRR